MTNYNSDRVLKTTYKYQKVSNIPVSNVKISDKFWAPKLKVLREVSIKDILDKFESDGAFRNFDFVREGKGGYHCGEPWFDGLIYETIRGVADILAVDYDAETDQRVDEIIEKVAQAQDAVGDGYINTYTLLDRPNQRWGDNGGNLRWQHDVYNAGCLVEAGVHHYKATGKISLLEVAVKFANHMSELMGPSPKRNIVPAHSLPEEALLKLYQLAMDEPKLAEKLSSPFIASEYLDLVKFWIENRGNHEGRPSWEAYSQDHKPLMEQDEAVGHAVRATLLYTGLTSLYLTTGEKKYVEKAKELWNNISYQKSHISGGIGAVHLEEKFGEAYELPDNGYLETCAAVGMGYFSWNLFLASGESKYIDTLENILYNILLAGRSMNGHKYSYENPLVSNGAHNRWEWHNCPCCPPMLVKMLPELASFIYAFDHEGVFVNLYVEGEAEVTIGDVKVHLLQKTTYPWDGSVGIVVSPAQAASFKVRTRVPEWCDNYSIKVNGDSINYTTINGYAVIDREWKSGDVIQLDLVMPVMLIEAHPYVKSHVNKVAIKRGPMLYCLESMDNEKYVIKRGAAQYTRESLDKEGTKSKLPVAPAFELEYLDDFFDGAVIIRTKDVEDNDITAIPYPYWNNRSRGSMTVWLQLERPIDLLGWENRLYRKVKPHITDK
ncbi:glycoside hydrolase family 127 protein [Paenibacillus psychroresistens]|uniref:Glycoside hydrolase family 127 protein n=1 Tax=Paenibacillus psychroresistens TaxID=1778678 RepID=A0A6B8RJ81_9BACL|nr:beta-L-arabinofuranosidase domain-containing protein [Paenibacillus psychroresistens]QGQ95446.1 glycoside hydrolase family 127 protein [Paenibacillus psychroresistens]